MRWRRDQETVLLLIRGIISLSFSPPLSGLFSFLLGFVLGYWRTHSPSSTQYVTKGLSSAVSNHWRLCHVLLLDQALPSVVQDLENAWQPLIKGDHKNLGFVLTLFVGWVNREGFRIWRMKHKLVSCHILFASTLPSAIYKLVSKGCFWFTETFLCAHVKC